MVEGYLRKWVNIMHGWKPRYFIIHDGLLFICDRKGGKRKGTVSLKIATISTTPEDSLRMVIHTGTNEIHVRADDAKELKKWYQALIDAQQDVIKRDDMQDYQQEKEIEAYERKLSPQAKSITKSSNLDSLKEKLAELWVFQAEFDETLSLIAPKVKSIPTLSENMSKLEQIGRDLKYSVTECVNKIEAEKKRMVSLAYKFDSANASGDINKRLDFGRDLEAPGNYEEDDNDTEFHSFESDEDDEEEEAKVFEGFQRPVSRQPSHSKGRDLEPINLNLGTALGTNKSVQLNPVIKHLLTANPVFLETQPISKEYKRDKLPYVLDPNQKFNVWAVAKDLIGKDLSRFAVPVWLNEPVSMLQKLCEQIEYTNLIDIGAQKDDPCLRMAYIMGFAFAYMASTTGRLKKPFNPILGETFEFVPPEGGVKFVSEQVSHHPPISAGYAENNNFQWWGDANIKTSFKGTSLEVRPNGSCHVVLKAHGDHFIYKRPVTGVHNIIIGSMYVDNFGDMPFSNNKTGDTGQLTLKKRGWGDKGAYEADGWIKNKSGTVRYNLTGKWNSHLTAIDATTKQEIKIWTRTPLPEGSHLYYNFSTFTMQLNHLYEDLIPKLPATDCRFRPDQRALEFGFFDMARDEKFRLEEKQRARRKDLQARGETHKPRWFEETKDPVTGEKEFKYLGGYFECREKGNFGEVLNLFD